MPNIRVLYFDSDRLINYQVLSDQVVRTDAYSPDPQGVAAFENALRAAKDDTYYLLAELAEEHYQVDLIPFVKGRYRDEIVARRLEKAFPNSEFRLSLSAGFDQGARLDEKLLLIGLPGTDKPDFWLRVLEANRIRVVGLFSISLLAPRLLTLLDQCGQWTIAVTLSPGGMRLTLCERNALRFSRLVSPPSFDPIDLAEFCGRETTKTIQYLLTVRILPKNLPQIAVLLLVPDFDKTLFEQALPPTLSLSPVFVTVEDCAQRLGLSSYPETGLTDSLIAKLLVSHTPKSQFAPPNRLQYFRLSEQKKWLIRLTTAIVVGCMAIVAVQAIHGFERYQRLTRLEKDNQTRRQTLERRIAAQRDIPQKLDQLPQIAVGYNLLWRYQNLDILGRLAAVDHLNQRQPLLHFDRVAWSLDNALPDEPAATETSRRPAALDAPLMLTFSFEGYLEFDDTLEASQRFAASLARLRRFTDDLAVQFNGATITLRRLPVDLSSNDRFVVDDDALNKTRYDFAIDSRFPALPEMTGERP